MTSVTTRSDSSFGLIQKRVPREVYERARGRCFPITLPAIGTAPETIVEVAIGKVIKLSLRVRDPSAAKLRNAAVLTQLEKIFHSIRSDAIELTQKQAVALSGEVYRLVVERFETEPGEPEVWEAFKGFSYAALDGRVPNPPTISWHEIMDERRAALDIFGVSSGPVLLDVIDSLPPGDNNRSLEVRFGLLTSWVLARHGLEVTPGSRAKLLHQVGVAAIYAGKTLRRAAEGDYSPDPDAARFPPVEIQPSSRGAKAPVNTSGKTSLTGLEEAWWAEALTIGKSESTHESYANSFRLLAKFLKHNDASRVTPEDIIAFKDHRLKTINPKTGKAVSPKTIKGSDLTAFKSVFDWAVSNRKLPMNPAQGVTLKLGKKTKLRERDFTDAEASALLTGANGVDLSPSPRNSFKTRQMKRWVPWLCAYSGSRVGELVQLRKEDLRQEAGAWIIQVTPEAGTVKTKEYRDVPLHEHLVEMGFMDFVQAAPSGYLFMDVKRDGSFLGVWQSKKNRLAEFAREFVTDPNVAPNHGWRHTFKSKGFEAGIQEKVLDALCGHAPATVGRAYGSVTLKTKVDAMMTFPRYQFSGDRMAQTHGDRI